MTYVIKAKSNLTGGTYYVREIDVNYTVEYCVTISMALKFYSLEYPTIAKQRIENGMDLYYKSYQLPPKRLLSLSVRHVIDL